MRLFSVLALQIALLAGAPAHAGDLCTDLKTLVASAQNDFHDLAMTSATPNARSLPVIQLAPLTPDYFCSLEPDGFHAVGGPAYACTIVSSERHADRDFAQEAANCFGAQAFELDRGAAVQVEGVTMIVYNPVTDSSLIEFGLSKGLAEWVRTRAKK